MRATTAERFGSLPTAGAPSRHPARALRADAYPVVDTPWSSLLALGSTALILAIVLSVFAAEYLLLWQVVVAPWLASVPAFPLR